MKKSKILVVALLGVMLAVGMILTGCPEPDPSPGGNPNDITYEIDQKGGTDFTATSTGIIFNFSASVDNLTAANITVSGAAEIGSATLSGSGKSWTLETITVKAAGMATVSINKNGIEAAQKSVIVFKTNEYVPEYWAITWNLNGGTAGTGAYPTLIIKDTVLAKPSPDPTRVGYTFSGWYSNSGLTQAYNFTNPVTANLNLYAKWEALGNPAHTHDWGEWTPTIIPGTETRVCRTDPSHIEHRLTGTDRFSFEQATSTSLSVSQGTLTSGEIYIPAYYRPNTDSIWFPVTEIGNEAFINTAITKVHIPDGVTSIGYLAFSNCTSLTGIEIPAGVTSIGDSAFSGCSSLTGIEIPAGVTSIGYSAFLQCHGLTSITVAAGNPNYASESGILYNKAKTEFILIPPRISGAVTIPAGVTSIGDYAFYWGYDDSSSLTSVTFAAGSQLQTIGNMAFSGCSSLTGITFAAGSQLQTIGNGAFSDCSSLTGIEIPAGVTSIGDGAFSGCSSLTGIEIPAGVTSIGNGAFVGCSSLTGIEIPAGVTSIGDFAFYGCTSLTGIEIPAGVTSIGGRAFSGCSSLTGITFAAGSQLQTIGDWAFSNCSSLTGIEIPAGVTSIGDSAFSGWTSSQTIYIRGHANQAAADAAWWGSSWRSFCYAVIKYWNGSEYI